MQQQIVLNPFGSQEISKDTGMAYEPALGIERLGTVKEIANAAGVGVATVHRVLKGQPKVSSSTSRAVLEAVKRINERKISRARLSPGDLTLPGLFRR